MPRSGLALEACGATAQCLVSLAQPEEREEKPHDLIISPTQWIPLPYLFRFQFHQEQERGFRKTPLRKDTDMSGSMGRRPDTISAKQEYRRESQKLTKATGPKHPQTLDIRA